MDDRDRQILTEIFEKLHHEINRSWTDAEYESSYKRLIIRELDEANQRAMLNLQLIEAKKPSWID